MQSLLTTIIHRPYVFLFLLSFFVIGVLNRGWTRTFLFLFLGYTIAFLSEFSSIRTGFPYGWYFYLYENLKGELLLGGVPVWDSLSYSFMAYASYEIAAWFTVYKKSPIAPLCQRGGGGIFSSTFLMVLLDIVTDPLAVRGDRWFLGKIFYYPHGGIYFGVPLSNFGGWFLVALCIFTSFTWLERKVPSPPPLRIPLLGPLFYGSIVFFNLLITLWIQEGKLALSGLLLQLVTFGTLKLFVPSSLLHQKKEPL